MSPMIRNNIKKPLKSSTIVLSAAFMLMLDSYSMAAVADAKTISKTKKNNEIVKLKEIKKNYQKLLVGEKNIASAMSIISSEDIKSASSSQSIYSILKQTPSVNEYQQNIGPGTPVLSIRGVRMSQLAQTLNGIPIQSLQYGGQGALLNYNIGSPVSLGQIEGIHVYPGVAPPDRNGFATVGGTIAYTAKTPSKDRYVDIFSKIGSFSTDNYGAELNTGVIPHTGGLRILTRISRTTTDGYIQNTPTQYRNFLFSADKPYDHGLSNISAIVIYNRGSGKIITEPLPVAQLDEYGLYYNYPLSEASNTEVNNYITAILGDSTYINSHIVVGAHLFYIGKSGTSSVYTNPNYINSTYPYQVNYAAPYFAYGPIGGPTNPNSGFSYNPSSIFGSYTAGEAAGIISSSSHTIGLAPKINIFYPHNDITIGGLVASESGTTSEYVYGTLNMPEISGYNALIDGNKSHRDVYSGYIQDKINILSDRLHIQPGITITGASSSLFVPQNIYGSPGYPYRLGNYDKVILPYLGVSYDFSKNLIAYASYGKDARFAPISNYTVSASGNVATTNAPGPETVNAYEAGLRFVNKRLYVNFDGYLQDMNGAFSFYNNQLTGVTQYLNIGKERTEGFELSGKYLANKELTVFGNASYTRAIYLNNFAAEVTPFGQQYGYAFSGDPLPFVPSWLANLGISYMRGPMSWKVWGSYTGPSTTTYDLPEDETLPALQDATVPFVGHYQNGYFLLNATASYKFPIHQFGMQWLKVTLSMDNILNNRYYTHYYRGVKQYGFLPVDQPYYVGFPGIPRFIEAGFTARF
ncbi:TonB-dependent receptor [Acidithiobacillus thiooxidans]|uniref:TonB-dependent receptor n=1 Tax=Acidithiobacillus thiooxidans TaxID=930 RepID=UPI00285C24C1|nr:TonB-dependent receptor [Acidithiobacillus thiooxidans]MDR7925802.1 TonB-dependent receptor [Acidithiobacillus thiooxidans]